MRIVKKEEKQMVVPPKNFRDYEWDEDFKLIMFCLDFTRNYFSGGTMSKEDKEKLKEWNFKKDQVYDDLWCRFKFYKGEAFDKKFSIVKSFIECSRCKNKIQMAEIKPIPFDAKYHGNEGKELS